MRALKSANRNKAGLVECIVSVVGKEAFEPEHFERNANKIHSKMTNFHVYSRRGFQGI